MQKIYLFCAFLCTHVLCAEPTTTLADGIDIAKLGIVVAKTGKAALNAAFPDAETQALEEAKRHALSVLRAQEELTQCLVTHARDPKDESRLPCACSQSAEEFVKFAGFSALCEVQQEFQQALAEIPSEMDNDTSFGETLKIAAKVGAIYVVFTMIPPMSPAVSGAAETAHAVVRGAVAAQIAANPVEATTFILETVESFDIFGTHQTARELQQLQESIAKKGTLRERIHKAHLK